MPQKEAVEREKRRAILFFDLGKATRRGVRFCPKCKTKNGTRGNVCKNKSCDVVFRDNNGSKRKATTDACRISTIGVLGEHQEIFSVRIRDRGPDYRNFVQLPISINATSSTSMLSSEMVSGVPNQSVPKCYVDICSKNKVYPCSHIKSAQNCFSVSEPILIKNATLLSLNIPYESKEVILQMFVKELPDRLIQRVSKTSFIVKCPISSRHPLGMLHILFFKPSIKEDRTSEPKFLCTCRPYKLTRGESEALSNDISTAVCETSTKLCVHYYACICAFASHEELELEFEYFVSHATSQEYPQRATVTNLGEMDLSSISHSNPEVIDVEPMDENQMSAEIIRENISLLESIAAADDSSLPNNLDNILPDQIIVASVDDSLNFGDSSALDGLDDPDAQVSGHLTHISEILSHTTNQQVVCQIFTNSNNLHLSNSFGNSENDVHDMSDQNEFLNIPSSLQRQQLNSPSQHSTLSKHTSSKRQKLSAYKGISKKDLNALNNSTAVSVSSSSEIQNNHDVIHSPVIENRLIQSGFENWLASINERINTTMNYQFDGKPEPFVSFVSEEHFEILKERITSGWKKKRLPNQTVIIHQRDRPPLGTFTKHIWRITNIVHVLHIFQCSIVPLKINQFFIQTASGSYDEWISTREETSKNTPIIPVLHSTSLRIGKLDIYTKETVPFTIEWTQDVLPQSKYGELSLKFQFNHSGPIHTDEERRNSCAPLQKLLQNHSFALSKHDLSRIGVSF